MFCTQCGTPFEQGQNFCKQCGARVNEHQSNLIPSGETSKRDTIYPAPVGPTRSAAEPYRRERKGISLTVIAAMCLTVIAAGSIYFGTDLFRRPAKKKTPAVASLPVANDANLPRPQGPEEKNSSGSPGNDNLSSDPARAQALIPLPDTSRPPAEASPKPAVKTDGTESSHKSPSPGAQASARSATKPPVAGPRRGSAGTYQTTRSTTLFESASSSSQVVANIPSGTRVDVVRAKGEWLEVHSRHGNPPGFIRREDAALIDKTE